MGRTLWLVDGEYVRKASAAQNIEIDFVRLKSWLERSVSSTISEGVYFSCLRDGATGLNSFHHFLQSPGPSGPELALRMFQLKTTGHHCHGCGSKSEKRVQKGVDVALATAMLTKMDSYDTLIVCAGDGDFIEAISHVQAAGKKVVIVGFDNTISNDLKAIAAKLLLVNLATQFVARPMISERKAS